MSSMPMELFLSDEVQTLLDDFASLLDIRVTFYSLAGEQFLFVIIFRLMCGNNIAGYIAGNLLITGKFHFK